MDNLEKYQDILPDQLQFGCSGLLTVFSPDMKPEAFGLWQEEKLCPGCECYTFCSKLHKYVLENPEELPSKVLVNFLRKED
ncbi:MAG: hypothetical protein HUJ78_02920 [Mogibacterium sp.]|nr:hypothetical protein [Mogibacterium sp.]MCF0239797.1 hypothetical protein [Streptococcus gallolyticus]